MSGAIISRQSMFPAGAAKAATDTDSFFDRLQDDLKAHPAFNHRFLKRFTEDKLTIGQLRTYFAQHYFFARRFNRNLAAIVSNVPDEAARTLLILNMYEEIGEPARLRDRVHLLLLDAGLITGAQLGTAFEEIARRGGEKDVVAVLIDTGVVSREQVAALVEKSVVQLKDLTHPALFRRYLSAIGLPVDELAKVAPLPATDLFNLEFREVCREGHWLAGMGAIGPATECLVPVLYTALLKGIRNSGLVDAPDCIFWVIHVECDDGHGRNIIDAIKPYADTAEGQALISKGAREVLDARVRWFDGLYPQVFGN